MHKILRLKEYQSCVAPSEIFSESGELLIQPELLGKNFFSVRYKKKELILQAGGYVGLFKLNSNLSMRVDAKVNIKNFSRILALSQGTPSALNAMEASYEYLMENIKSINVYLIESFLHFVEQVHVAGFHKEYTTITQSNSLPKGRIDFKKTLNSFNKTVITHTFNQRSINTECNQIVKWMLVELLKDKEFCKKNTNKYKIIKLLSSMDKVTYVRFDTNYLNKVFSEVFLAKLNGNYRNLFSIIKIIINQWSVDLLSVGKTKAYSIIINLENVFEKYLLNSLIIKSSILNELSILDGNQKPPSGGAKGLFSETAGDEYFYGASVTATPDIVVFSSEFKFRNIVIDVKYKVVDNLCDREDLNQIITYVSSYEACAGILIIPMHQNTKYKIQCLGSILGRSIYQYSFDLNAVDLNKEEKEFYEFLIKILNKRG